MNCGISWQLQFPFHPSLWTSLAAGLALKSKKRKRKRKKETLDLTTMAPPSWRSDSKCLMPCMALCCFGRCHTHTHWQKCGVFVPPDGPRVFQLPGPPPVLLSPCHWGEGHRPFIITLAWPTYRKEGRVCFLRPDFAPLCYLPGPSCLWSYDPYFREPWLLLFNKYWLRDFILQHDVAEC